MPARNLLFSGIIIVLWGLTPLFAVAIVAAILLAARLQPKGSRFLASYVSRVVVHFLVFSALTMVVAMLAWLAQMPLHVILVLVPYLLVVWLLARYVPLEKSRGPWVNGDDWLSAVLGIIPLGIIALTFYLPHPSLAATVQLVTNGFDNGAHLSIIQSTYENHGHVYGAYEDIKNDIAWKTLTAYPQGWHIASALQWQGLNLPVFETDSRSVALNLYVITLLFWLWLAAFFCSKVSLYVLRLVGLKNRLKEPGLFIGFMAAQLLLQLVVLWGSLYFGFATFIGVISYFMLLMALLLEFRDTGKKQAMFYYFAAGLVVAAIGLMWLLPVLSALAMAALVFAPQLTKVSLKRGLVYAGGSLLLLVPILSMVMVSRLYSVQPHQLNDHGGIFEVSTLFVGIAVAAAAYLFLCNAKPVLRVGFMAIVAPQLLFAAAIYAYQYATIGGLEYFFTKSIALALIIVSPFAVAAFIRTLSRLTFSTWRWAYTAASAMLILVIVVMLSSQSLESVRALVQRASRITNETAEVYARTAASGELMQRNVITLTRIDYGGDVNANVLSTALNTKFSRCVGDAIWTISDHHGDLFPEWIEKCARNPREHITAISGPETQPLFDAFPNQNLRVLLAK